MGKLWKPNKAAASNKAVARSKSIRGQISTPVPISKALYEVANEPAPTERQIPVIMEEPLSHSDSVPRFHEHFSDQDSQWRLTTSNEFSYELPGAELSSRNLAKSKKLKLHSSRPGSSNKNVPQRRKSTIRTTLGRLFGGKKRDTSVELAFEETLLEETLLEDEEQHYTTAPPLPRHIEPEPEPVPVQTISETSTPQYPETPSIHSAAEELQAEERPRTATYDVSRLSSRFSFNYPGSLTVPDSYSESEPVPPLPSSSLVRRQSLTSIIETATSNQGGIGMAISSDSPLLKRRSRSLSVLVTPQVVEEFRRRSEDVKRIRDADEPAIKSPVSGTYPTADELKAFSLDLPIAAPRQSPPPPPAQQPHIAACCDPHAEPEVVVELEATEAPTINDRVTTVEDRLSRLEVFVQPARASTYLGQVATRGVTVEHVNSLLDLLENERAARIELETQVAYLAHQVTYLVTGSAPAITAYPSSDMSPIRTSAFDDDDDSDTDLDDIDLDDMECYETPFRRSPRESLILGKSAFAAKQDDVTRDAFDASKAATEHQYNLGVYDQHEPQGMSEARVVSFSRVSMSENPAHVI